MNFELVKTMNVRNEYDLSEDRVNAFREVTRDPNELHKVYALGIQEWLMAKERADIYGYLEKNTFVQVYAAFEKPVPINSKLQVNPGQVRGFIDGSGAQNSIVPLELMLGEDTALTSEFNYVTFPQHEPGPESIILPHSVKQAIRGRKGVEYVLTTAEAEQAAYGLDQEGTNYAALAIGFFSAQLFIDGENVMKKHKRKYPMYTEHRIVLAPELQNLKDGDKITVSTYPIKDEGNKFIAGIAGFNENELLYRGDVHIRFTNPRILARHQKKE